ncbi:transposase [Streptomyces glycanivorans]|uniref:Transposase n=1 Tax=Streptomyces glycanivorans TaxID=3033808 RepID=A0ABY9JRI0_9ACTN|nr:transposase [Streptomyces sp. Alt3]WLQ69268.1 transposase [Streptomyces sp. Alt3]
MAHPACNDRRVVTSDQVELWGAELAGLGPRGAGCFERSEPRATAVAYVRELLADVPRKNGWQLAEQASASRPWSMQRLLGAARWDADGVCDVVLSYVVERLGEAGAVLVLDETGFASKLELGAEWWPCAAAGAPFA